MLSGQWTPGSLALHTTQCQLQRTMIVIKDTWLFTVVSSLYCTDYSLLILRYSPSTLGLAGQVWPWWVLLWLVLAAACWTLVVASWYLHFAVSTQLSLLCHSASGGWGSTQLLWKYDQGNVNVIGIQVMWDSGEYMYIILLHMISNAKPTSYTWIWINHCQLQLKL